MDYGPDTYAENILRTCSACGRKFTYESLDCSNYPWRIDIECLEYYDFRSYGLNQCDCCENIYCAVCKFRYMFDVGEQLGDFDLCFKHFRKAFVNGELKNNADDEYYADTPYERYEIDKDAYQMNRLHSMEFQYARTIQRYWRSKRFSPQARTIQVESAYSLKGENC